MLFQLLAHHSEAAHPDLLDAIKDRLDTIFNVGPTTVVLVLGLVIVAIPIGILLLYALQKRRGSA